MPSEKVLEQKKSVAKTLLINVGNEHGVKVGDRFRIQTIEMIDGQPYPTEIGVISVKKLSGSTFCECDVPSKIGEAVLSSYTSKQRIECELIVR